MCRPLPRPDLLDSVYATIATLSSPNAARASSSVSAAPIFFAAAAIAAPSLPSGAAAAASAFPASASPAVLSSVSSACALRYGSISAAGRSAADAAQPTSSRTASTALLAPMSPPSADGDQRNLALVGDGAAVRGDGNLRRGVLGQLDERARGRRLRLRDHQRDAAVAADADRLVDRQPSEERHPQLGGDLLAAAMAEDVRLDVAVRARVVAHVLDDAQ